MQKGRAVMGAAFVLKSFLLGADGRALSGLLKLADDAFKRELACLALASKCEQGKGFRCEAGRGFEALDALEEWIWRCHGLGCVHSGLAGMCVHGLNAGMISLAIVFNVTCALAFAMAFKSRLPVAVWWKQWVQALMSTGGACFAGLLVSTAFFERAPLSGLLVSALLGAFVGAFANFRVVWPEDDRAQAALERFLEREAARATRRVDGEM